MQKAPKMIGIVAGIIIFLVTKSVLVACLTYLAIGYLSNALNNKKETGDPWSNAWEQKWKAVGEGLGLEAKVRDSKSNPSSIRGTVNGYRVTVYSQVDGDPEIEVDLNSGLQSLHIGPREGATITPRHELSTGDIRFDTTFMVVSQQNESDDYIRSWLNSKRRMALLTLDEALDIKEVEEDELEVHLGRTNWQAEHLIEAIELCVMVASVLDASAADSSPQDALPEASQDAIRETPQDTIREVPRNEQLD